MIERLAIVTTEIPPPLRHPCAGGAVRVWGVGEALRRSGVPCQYLLDERTSSRIEPTGDIPIVFYKPELLQEELARAECDAVLFEQWQPLTCLRSPLDLPVIVDLPGPLILEYFWRDRDNFHQHIADKVECLSRGDYFLCACERQRGYYGSWLTWAGVPPGEDRLGVVPFTLHEMPRSRQGHVEDEPLFFWGGMFWPWQERDAAFQIILETITQLRKGQLVIVGELTGREENLFGVENLREHLHVTNIGSLPFSEYVCELKRARVAVDLCKPTLERELASDLRTGTALWAGIPSLVTPQSPWADEIEARNAGWVVPYDDEDRLRSLIKEIALERCDIVAKRRGAKEISARISHDENVSPLLNFLQNPDKREKTPTFFEARFKDREDRLREMRDELNLLRHEKETLQRDLDSIRSKTLFHIYKKLTSWRK